MTVYKFRTYQLSDWASDNQRRASYASAQRQLGYQLYEILMSQPLPVVVDIKEELLPASAAHDYPTFHDVLEIQVEVIPFQHKHMTFFHADWDFRGYRATREDGIGYHLREIWRLLLHR